MSVATKRNQVFIIRMPWVLKRNHRHLCCILLQVQLQKEDHVGDVLMYTHLIISISVGTIFLYLQLHCPFQKNKI